MKKKVLAVSCIASLLLAGCQSTGTSETPSPEFPKLAVRAQQKIDQCETRKFSTTTAYIKCLNDADAIVLPALTPQLANAWQLRTNRRKALAEKVERKEITSTAEIKAELRQITDQSVNDIRRILRK